jgi:cytochrome P450
VTPPPAPQPLWKNLRAFVDNPLTSLPIQAYTQPVTVFRPTPGFAVAWVSDPALIETILVSGRDAFSRSRIEKRVFQRLLGEGVLTAEGQLWRWQRRVLAPLFRHQDILSYVPAMSAAAREQIARWREGGPGMRAVDEAMTATTFSVITRTMLAGGEPRETAQILAWGKRYLSRVSWEIAFGILRLPEWLPHPGS